MPVFAGMIGRNPALEAPRWVPEMQSVVQNCYATAARKAARRLTALYDGILAPAGLRSTQFAILSQLAVGGPASINELARVLVLDRSGLGHSLRPLQRDGLITLGQDPSDRRSVTVTLTDQGKQKFEAAYGLWQSAQDQVVAVLGATEAAELRDRLNTVAEDDRLS
ncbi:MarR family winged helix-turn-helix transcriptional regulator [Actinoplanes sp. HUAS TT8]|uniref:MarR family winged helix-turn-helix transcriptional regulator n=1 Tax=Actinoplanes sp. HUAS TT8 TaxID=3447453 RepID=UPI003F523ECF